METPGTGSDLHDALQTLQREVRFLEAQMEALSGRLEKARKASRLVGEMIDAQSVLEPASPHEGDVETAGVISRSNSISPRPSSKRDAQKDRVIQVARELIIEAGRPLTRRELWNGFRERGFEVEAKEPPRYIGKILWGEEEFENVTNEGYWVKGAIRSDLGIRAGDEQGS